MAVWLFLGGRACEFVFRLYPGSFSFFLSVGSVVEGSRYMREAVVKYKRLMTTHCLSTTWDQEVHSIPMTQYGR